MSSSIAVAIAGLSACAVTSAGIYTISRFEEAARRYSVYFVSFAAGVLITVSFLHLIPHSIKLTGSAPAYVLAGLLGLYLIDRLLERHGHEEAPPHSGAGTAAMIGIGLHSLLDGMIFSITFTAGMTTGILSAVGMVLHEFPEGIIMFTLLERFGYDRRHAVWIAFLVAGVTTPAGVLVSYPFVRRLDLSALAPLIAACGGALVYVGASHLLPMTLQEKKGGTLLFLCLGVVLAALVILVKHA